MKKVLIGFCLFMSLGLYLGCEKEDFAPETTTLRNDAIAPQKMSRSQPLEEIQLVIDWDKYEFQTPTLQN